MFPFCYTTAAFSAGLETALHRTSGLQIGNKIGSGGIGRVFRATCHRTQEQFAVKRVALPAGSEQRLEVLQRVAREAAAAQALAMVQPYPDSIVRHYACVFHKEADEFEFVMQLCDGPSLAELRRQEAGGRLPEARVRRMLANVARAIGALHSAGLLCVDVKSENVVLAPTDQEPDRVLLLDFDLCRDLPGHDRCEAAVAAAAAAEVAAGAPAPKEQSPPDRIWGTAEYLAYEVMKNGSAAYSPASDWWALGVLSYELLYGNTPWSGPTLEALMQRMAHYPPAFPGPSEGGPQVSSSMQQFIRSLLRHRPEVRQGSNDGVRDVLAHPALQVVS